MFVGQETPTPPKKRKFQTGSYSFLGMEFHVTANCVQIKMNRGRTKLHWVSLVQSVQEWIQNFGQVPEVWRPTPGNKLDFGRFLLFPVSGCLVTKVLVSLLVAFSEVCTTRRI